MPELTPGSKMSLLELGHKKSSIVYARYVCLQHILQDWIELQLVGKANDPQELVDKGNGPHRNILCSFN
jgi:hypothetical protein